MEFVLHPTLPSQIILGPRVAPGVGNLSAQSQAQQVLVAIVKATFAADDPSATPLPADQQVPLFQQDQLFADETTRQEHDLAMYKPRADVVVLGAPAPPHPGPIGGTWTERVILGGVVMSGTFPNPEAIQVTFGWEKRVEGTRNGYAGQVDTFDPDSMELPLGFNNLFFNGGLYQGTAQPRFAHPSTGALATVESRAQYDLGGGATETRTTTRRLHLPAAGPEATITFRKGPPTDAPTTSQPLDMNVDTIVYDKSSGRFYVVWRGVWEYASVPAERYVSLVLS